MVSGAAGSRAMVRTRSSLAGQTFAAHKHLTRETRPAPPSAECAYVCRLPILKYVSTSLLLPCVHARSRGRARVIGLQLSVR